jgi:hypothetical protein
LDDATVLSATLALNHSRLREIGGEIYPVQTDKVKNQKLRVMFFSGTDLEELKDFLMSELLWSERKILFAVFHQNENERARKRDQRAKAITDRTKESYLASLWRILNMICILCLQCCCVLGT